MGVLLTVILGVLAFVLGLAGLTSINKNKNSRWLSYASLSFNALAICASYSQIVTWVEQEDLSALMDVVPTMSTMSWLLTLVVVGINGGAFYKETKLKVD